MTPRVGPGPSLPPAPYSACWCRGAWASWRTWLLHVVVPVEWSGAYSVDKLLGLVGARPSLWRVSLVLVLTPLPALTVSLLCELLSLNDPALGWRRNGAFFTRSWIRMSLVSFAVDAVIEHYLPQLRLPWAHRLILNATQGAVACATAIAVSEATGAFPVPFMVGVTLPVYAVCSWLLRYLCEYHARIRDPAPQETRRGVVRIMKLINVTAGQIYTYAVFGFTFAYVPERWRSLAALSFVGIKFVSARGQWRCAQALLASGCNDFATAHVAFGTQFFHALFVAASLQQSRTITTIVAIVSVSTAQDLTVVCLLQRRIASVARMTGRDGSRARRLQEIATRWQQSTSLHDAAKASPFPASAWSWRRGVHAIIAVSPTPMNVVPLTPRDHEFLKAVQSLCQCREATLLRFYVDVFVPVVFFVYVVVVKSLPNGEYVSFVHGSETRALALRLGVPLGVKLATFVLLLRSLDARGGIGITTGLQQLAFALERMGIIAQVKTLLAMFWAFDFWLLHNGNDLTFQFRWLRDGKT